MKRLRIHLDPAQKALVEQSLKLTPSERWQYAMGLAQFALDLNPNLMRYRAHFATWNRHR